MGCTGIEPILSKEESLRQDFKFLILTQSQSEWPMNPDLGVGLRRYLFENYSADSLRGVKLGYTVSCKNIYQSKIDIGNIQFGIMTKWTHQKYLCQ